MAVKIALPARAHGEFGSCITRLARVVEMIYKVEDDEIILDFSNTRMLSPIFLGGLACSMSHFTNHGKNFSMEGMENIFSYMKTVCFPNCFDFSYGSSFLDTLKNKTYIPIIKFPTGQTSNHDLIRDQVLSAITNLLKIQLSYSERERMPLAYMLTELTNNINDHSGATEGFVFGQFYPNSYYLDLCICDHGKGVYQSYLDTSKFFPKSEIEAVEFAINGRSTKDRSEARGFGISTSRELLVRGLGGKFYMWSGKTAYMQSAENVGIINMSQDFHYQGTYIALRMPIQIPVNFNLYDYTG